MKPTGSAPATLYSCFNFRLRSAIRLDELVQAPKEGDERPIVDVRLGAVAESLPGAAPPLHGLQAAGGEALLTVPNVGRYLARDGLEIVVDPAPGASERNVRLFLLGSALGMICHQRGLLPLHANAIVAGGAAVGFAGRSGAGKSTLAAHFQKSGYEVLCDDVCILSFDAEGEAFAWPGLPRLKLWGDAASALGHDPAALDRAMDGMDKYHVPVSAAGPARPIPFRRLYVLGRAEESEEGQILRLRGREAMEAVLAQTYRGAYLAPMGLTGRHFAQCAALLASAEIWSASRAWGYDVFKREAARLEQHLSSA
ncbi:MAG TPA: hypothetical protein VK472_02505 [Allosphingosinicella sp.]|nr:hypothetical protein [Allosphingosinicella sp.]